MSVKCPFSTAGHSEVVGEDEMIQVSITSTEEVEEPT